MSDTEQDAINHSLPHLLITTPEDEIRKFFERVNRPRDLRGVKIVTPPDAKRLNIVTSSDRPYAIMLLETTDEKSSLLPRPGRKMLNDLGWEYTGSFDANGNVRLPRFDIDLTAMRSPYKQIYGWRFTSEEPHLLFVATMVLCKTDWEKLAAVLRNDRVADNRLSLAYDPWSRLWYVPCQWARSHPDYDVTIKTLYMGMTEDPGEKAEIERFCDHTDKSAVEVWEGYKALMCLTEGLTRRLEGKPKSNWNEQERLAKKFQDSNRMLSKGMRLQSQCNVYRPILEGPAET